MNENEFEKQLKKSIHHLDHFEINTPDLSYFTDLVKQEKLKIAKRQNLQTALFIVAAILIISAILLIFFTNVLVFAVLQGGLLVLFISLTMYKLKSGGFR